MPATLAVTPPPDLAPITRMIRMTRRWLRTAWCVIGFSLMVGMALGVLAFTATIDMVIPLVGPWVRLPGLILFGLLGGYALVMGLVVPMVRRLGDVEIARRIEARIPGMHCRLVSCVDLAEKKNIVSPAFYRRLISESLEQAKGYRATSIVDFPGLRNTLIVAAFSGGLFTLLLGLLGGRFGTALQRVFQPFADIPPVARVAYSVQPGSTKLLRDTPIIFEVTISTATQPESLRLELQGENDSIQHHDLERCADGAWRCEIKGLSAETGFGQSFTYRIHGGGTWSKKHEITWIERPAILGITASVHFARHLMIAESEPVPGNKDHDVVGPEIVGPTMSQAEVKVAVTGPVVQGWIHLSETRTLPIPTSDWSGERWFESEEIKRASYPMQSLGDGHWSGKFPLEGKGKYHLELINEFGMANQPIKDRPRFAGVSDRQPNVRIDRPAANLALAAPGKIALIVTAEDDYGLDELALTIQREHEQSFRKIMTIKSYDPYHAPVRAETLIFEMDLSTKPLDLKNGTVLRYRVEARDRSGRKDAARSKDYQITIRDDVDSDDNALEAFQRNQEPFREKLVQLIAEQAMVNQNIEQTVTRFHVLNEKIQRAIIEESLRPELGPDGKPPDAGSAATSLLRRLEPEALKNLEALRRELNELFSQERKNVGLAQQMANQLQATLKNAQQMPLLDVKIADHLKELKDHFEALALDPLKDLAEQMRRGAQPNQTPPNLMAMRRQSRRLQDELTALLNRANALADAQKRMRADRPQALAQLMNDMLKERGQLNARELADLKEFLKAMREEMDRLKDRQIDLGKDTEKAPATELPRLEKNQDLFDKLFGEKKKDLMDLLDTVRQRRNPGDSLALDPKKQDEDEPTFMPNLSGEKFKPEPSRKDRPQTPAKNDPHSRRENLQDRQMQNLRDIDSAQKALRSDENALEQMMRQLMEQAQKLGPKGQPGRDGMQQQNLRDLLGSEAMQKALQMAQRARQQDAQRGPRQGQPKQPGSQPNLNGNPASANMEAMLNKLSAEERRILLALPPHIREELLQGERLDGPEAYQKFIREYSRRLFELQQKPR